MERGDISNSFPQRILIHLDVITAKVDEKVRIMGLIPKTRTRVVFDRLALNRMWNLSSRLGVSLELFDVDCDQSDMDEVDATLDRGGLNPFRACVAYSTVQQLISDLPFRPEVLGVADVPERAFRYGSKYFDLSRV
jgi:hypothetical protein